MAVRSRKMMFTKKKRSPLPKLSGIDSDRFYVLFSFKVEPSRVELLSKSAIHLPIRSQV